MAAAQHNSKKPTIPVPKVSKTTSQTTEVTVSKETELSQKLSGLSNNNVPNEAAENTISMVFGAIVIGIILLLAVSFWRDWQNSRAENAGESQSQEEEQQLVDVQELPDPASVMTEADDSGNQVPVNLPARYTVKSGDSTWKVAMAFYGSGFNYVDIEAANGLQPDSDLNVGQQLTIPRVPVRDTAGGRPAGEYEQSAATPTTEASPAKGDTSAETEMQAERTE